MKTKHTYLFERMASFRPWSMLSDPWTQKIEESLDLDDLGYLDMYMSISRTANLVLCDLEY